jgi:hypothetical protein
MKPWIEKKDLTAFILDIYPHGVYDIGNHTRRQKGSVVIDEPWGYIADRQVHISQGE